MAKTKTPKAPKPPKPPKPPKAVCKGPEAVPVEYDLFTLPTAFHKAGLAGLVLLIRSLVERDKLKSDGAKYEMTPTTLTVTFTEPLIRALFDDVYDARVVEVFSKTKWQGTEPKREESVEETVNGKQVKTKRYVYDQVQPCGTFFDTAFDGEKEVWRKLWRDMLWNIPRGRPLTRIPFNERSEGRSCGEGGTAWEDLLKVHKARGRSEFYTTELSSALFPGAQAVNAEGVPFDGRAEENLLLHFWPLVCSLFVPNVVEADGSSDFVGYTIAVPEVAELTEFVQLYPLYLDSLSPRVRGYRPAEAVVDLAAEGGLAVLDRMAELTEQVMKERRLSCAVSAVEYLHLVKIGNNVKSLAAGRVSPNADLLSAYHSLVRPRPGVDPVFRNSLFRRGLLFALLDGKLWYEPFRKLFAAFDVDVFLRQPRRSDDADSKAPPQFASDAAAKLRHETRSHTATIERFKSMPDQSPPKRPLELLVDQVVRSFLIGKAKSKCNIDKKKKLKELSKEEQKRVYDKKRDVAEEAFLAVRSRRDQDFVKYFTEVICSAGTYFDRKTSDYLDFAIALNDSSKTDSIKALTLLSLSANS